MSQTYKKIIPALDTSDWQVFCSQLKSLDGLVENIKIGMECFYTFGERAMDKARTEGFGVFLDLKLHDIPNTVEKSLGSLLQKYRPFMINVHIAGGPEMLRRAVLARNENSRTTCLIGVSVLTSLNASDLSQVGCLDDPMKLVIERAQLAKVCGLDGIVCSPLELEAIKSQKSGVQDLLTIVPGIRLEANSKDDQKRTMTPESALQAGADFLVMGRSLKDNPAEKLAKLKL